MTETRGERKERTRRAILDAALGLSAETTLAAVSLRQVAKEVGIVPTAFYRHFESVEDLGLALVEESLDNLRVLLREIRRTDAADFRSIIDGSVTVLVEQVRLHHAHYNFIARERFGGSVRVRRAIEHGIDLAARDLAIDLAHLPGTDEWSEDDLRAVSGLIVSLMVVIVERLVVVEPHSAAERTIADTARTQLRMLLIGALQWRSGR